MNSCSLESHLLELLIAGIVGPETAASFFGWMATNDIAIPGALQTLEDFIAQKEKYAALLEMNRMDILNLALKNLVKYFQPNGQHLKNLNLLLEYLPEEFAIMFFKYFASKRMDDFEILMEKLPVFDKISDSIVDFIGS